MDILRAAARHVGGRVARPRSPGRRSPPSGRWVPWRAAAGERGQGLAEYALILALIAILAVSALLFLGGVTTGMFWDPIISEFQRIVDVLLP